MTKPSRYIRGSRNRDSVYVSVNENSPPFGTVFISVGDASRVADLVLDEKGLGEMIGALLECQEFLREKSQPVKVLREVVTTVEKVIRRDEVLPTDTVIG